MSSTLTGNGSAGEGEGIAKEKVNKGTIKYSTLIATPVLSSKHHNSIELIKALQCITTNNLTGCYYSFALCRPFNQTYLSYSLHSQAHLVGIR